MSPRLLAGGIADAEAAARLADVAAFRKATQSMLLVVDAIGTALALLPESARATLSTWGVVVGADHGEIEVTKDFLCTLKARGMARPFLFQNSLHNATLGFLSMHFGLTGPGATTSTRFFSGEDALDLARDYVASGATAVCLAIGVEALDAAMVPAAQATLGPAARCGNGAAAVIVASAAFAQAHGLEGLARLESIQCERRPRLDARPRETLADYYGANAIAHVALALDDGRTSLSLLKPDGARSLIQLASPH